MYTRMNMLFKHTICLLPKQHLELFEVITLNFFSFGKTITRVKKCYSTKIFI